MIVIGMVALKYKSGKHNCVFCVCVCERERERKPIVCILMRHCVNSAKQAAMEVS